MNPTDFLSCFSTYTDEALSSLRRSSVLDQFPREPSTYTEIAKAFFAGFNQDWAGRQRLVSILREFLYHDGRSFEALLSIAARAASEPEYFANGINSLAGLYCYLNQNRPAPVSEEVLLEHFKRFAVEPELRHNAEVCREVTLRRRPDLRESSPDP